MRYSDMIIFSILCNILVVFILSKKFNCLFADVICMLMFNIVGIVSGSLIYSFLLNGKFTLSSVGAVLGGFFALFLYSFLFKKDYRYIVALFSPSVPLMYAIGKIGCLIVGCCHGIPYDGVGKIIYHNSLVAPNGVGVFPIQIFETIVFMAIFIYVFRKYCLNQFSIKLVIKEIIICGVAKFLLDFLRYDHIDKFITNNQFICLIMIFVSFIYLIIFNKKIKG